MTGANRARSALARLVTDPKPRRALAVLTCMDVRIDPLAMLGLHIGEAHVLRNAGGRVTDDVMRSLAVSSHVLGTRLLLIVQHTQCGLRTATQRELADLTGADIPFLTISDHAGALRCDAELAFDTPYLSKLETVVGLLYDVETGNLDQHVRRDRR